MGGDKARHPPGQRRLADSLRTAENPGVRQASGAPGVEEIGLRRLVAEQDMGVARMRGGSETVAFRRRLDSADHARDHLHDLVPRLGRLARDQLRDGEFVDLTAWRGAMLGPIMVNRVFLALLLFVPIAIGANIAGVSPAIVFFLAALAIVPLAKFIGESTEELATRTGPALGGLLSATFGNATELIIGLLALHAGLIEVVKASITGSVIGNLLLVLGLAMLSGGWGRKSQTFNKTGILANGSTLLLGTIALIIPAIFSQTAPSVAPAVLERLSVVVSAILILVYAATLFFSLHTHKHLYLEDVGTFEPRWSVWRALATLLCATLAVAFVSDILVGSITPLVAQLGWSQLFVGVIFVAVIGNRQFRHRPVCFFDLLTEPPAGEFP